MTEDLASCCGFAVVEAAVGGWGFLQRRRLSALPGDGVVDSTAQLAELLDEIGVLVEAGFDAAQGVEDGSVVAAAIEAADLGQGEVGQFAGEEDRRLPGVERGSGAAAA